MGARVIVRVGLWLVPAVLVGGMWVRSAGAAGGKTGSAAAAPALDQGPARRSPSEAGIGRLLPLADGSDLAGKTIPLTRTLGKQGLVLAVVSSSCPAGKRFAPVLGRLEATWAPRGLAFAYLAPLDSDSSDSLRTLARTAGLRGPLLRDSGGRLCSRLGITSTTEVLLLDGARTLVYRGAVSDQYGPTWSLETPRRNYLAEGIQAMLTGAPLDSPATTAPGCVLPPSGTRPAVALATYHAEIARLMQAHCTDCHRKQGLAPFSLETQQDIVSHAAMIERVVTEGRMPPWFAAPTPDDRPSPWAHNRSLPSRDRATLLAWLRSARPAGSPRDAPLPRRFSSEWQIGKPDVTFQLPEPVPVQAEGVMPYVTRQIETHFAEDRWVQAIEVAPTAREVVHHVLVFVDPAPTGRQRNAFRDELSGYFGIYVPGNSSVVYPPGFAKKIPAGARLRFQIHYTPNGTATTDQTRVAFRFAPEPPKHEVHVVAVANVRIAIPPGAPDHAEQGVLQVPAAARILGFLPHMHLRGKAARYELVEPDGTRRLLLDVPRYDFNWQLCYRLQEPLAVQPGSRIEFTGRYNNSAANPANPDPNRLVRWGAQTTDEMLVGYVEYYLEEPGGTPLRPSLAELTGPAGDVGGLPGNGALVDALFRRLDRDRDGKLTPAELVNARLFQRLDANSDGMVTLEEARSGLPALRPTP